MNGVPRSIVAARRTAGAILITAAVATVIAGTSLTGWWISLPPTVTPLPPPTSTPTPTTVVVPTAQDAGAQLQQIRYGDAATVAALPDGAWVTQLSSKRIGPLPDGMTYTDQSILDDHNRLRAAYSDVALLWSGDFATFTYSDFWVTIRTTAYASPEQANAWCDAAGLDGDHCYAKRISTTTSYSPNTVHR